METIKFMALIVTMVAGFGFIYRKIKSMEKQIRDDIKTEVDRSDRLYNMFIQLLSSRKKRTDP